MKRFKIYFAIAFALFASIGEVHAQTEPNTKEIINQATVFFDNPFGRGKVSVTSNSVKVLLGTNPAFSLGPNNVISSYKNKVVGLTQTLTNTGSASATLDISVSNMSEDDFDLENMQWFNQQRKSMLARQASQSGTNNTLQTTVTLQPGDSFEFSYGGKISNNVEGQLQALLDVTVNPRGFDRVYHNVDTVNVLVGTRLNLEKKQVNADNLQPGDTFSYQLTGQNIGDVNAPGRTIFIDGVQRNKVVLSDSIPANTTFVSFQGLSKGTALYHTPGNDKYDLTTSPPADLSSVDIIAVAYDSLVVNEQVQATFSVRINNNAGGQLHNVAEFSFMNPEGSVTTTTASNEVVAKLPENNGYLNFYTDGNFDQKTGASGVGDPLFLESSAGVCNESSSIIETVRLILNSEKTGDLETASALETGYNTGTFRIENPLPTRNGNDYNVVKGNDILETVEKDQLEAVLDCQGLQNGSGSSESITANVVVDPTGIVFDSETNKPVEGAKVSIINTATGQLADVYNMSRTAQLDNPQTTGADGGFHFTFLETGSYKLEIEPPEGYTFASKVPTNLLPSDRNIDEQGSFGETFSFAKDPGSGVDFDIPLDPKREGVLFVDKKADRKEAEIGDFVNYTITIRSEAVNTVNNLSIRDQLPFGFEYQPGSAHLDGNSIADPEGGKGPDLTFKVGNIAPGSSKKLTYKLMVGPGAKRGDGTNTAIAQSDEIITRVSNEAKIKIEVRGGVFSTEGFIIGKVFSDCNQNGQQDLGEMGIPGVRLYLENGNYVITDARGMYTFYGIRPNMHILKLDNHSLPEGSRLKDFDNRFAGDPSSRFVDLKKGEMHRAEFAVCNCSDKIHREIIKRKATYSNAQSDDLSKSVKKNLTVNERSSQRRHNEASGTVGNTNTPNPTAKKLTSANDQLSEKEAAARPSIEEALATTSNELGFVHIADGDTISTKKLTIWTKGKAGATLKLSVNGKEIGSNKVGQKSLATGRSLQIWEYVSIAMNEGANVLLLEEVDPFGNRRDSTEISIVSAGALSELKITVPRNNVNADGQTVAVVRVQLLDKDGVEIGSKIPITLDTSVGTWKITDENKHEPGTQTFVENGHRDFELISPIEPNTATVKAYAGQLEDEAEVNFLPDLRPLIAAGIIQGTVRLSDPLNIQSTTSADGFERELTSLSYSMENFTGDARIAFFLKGKISGDMLLTARYDSEKDKDDQLFRDIRPDEFYPVYGESSIKGFDAQSSTRLYIRVDKKKTYALYGDFITQEHDPDRQLGNYSRAQTGVKAHFEKGRFTANVFGSNPVSQQRIRRIQGQGISRYQLPDKNIVDNSEIIEIITVDRNQPDLITNVKRLRRFRDYVLEPFSGVITFRSPVPGVDEHFNPIFIRATYEVENDNERYLIGGANSSFEVSDDLTVGASVVHDDNPDNRFTMASGNVSVQLGENTKAIGEIAHTRSQLEGNGMAERIKLQHRGTKADLTAEFAKSDEDFSNPSATLGPARTEAKATGRYNLTSSINMNGEFLLSRNDTTGAQTVGGVLNLQKTFAQNFNAELGIRHSRQTGGAQNSTNTNIRGKAMADLPFLKGASINAEYEQNLENIDQKIIAAGVDYQLDWGKFYANHEFISSAQGAYTLSSSQRRHNTAIGFDADYMKNGRVYSEYRIDNGIDGRSGQAAIGVRNQFIIYEGFGINAGFERTFTVEGMPTNDGTSITTSVDYTANPNWKGTARLEARFTRNTDTYFSTWGYGQKISNDWTFLGKNVLALNTQNGISGFSKIQERLRLGTAYRDITTDNFDALFRYEIKYEEDANIDDDYYRIAHIFSTHANYNLHPDWTISGRLAAKKATEYRNQLRAESFLELASTRLIYDITNRLDASMNGSLLMNADFSQKDYGVGIEAGYVLAQNFRVALGFNFFGYEDEDLAVNNYTRKGVYAGVSYKFDEQILRSLIPKRSHNIIDESIYQTCPPCKEPEPMNLTQLTYTADIPTITARKLKTDFKLHVLPNHIHFANNKTYINQPAAKMLDIMANYLNQKDGHSYSIDITGHTDSKSSYRYNLALSQRRAYAVRAYLVAAGIDPDKMQLKGLSYSNELRKENDRVDMAMNRRVELELKIDDEIMRIPQIEDLQVNKNVPGIPQWDYIFVSRRNAVPQQLTITTDTLNAVQEFMMQRIGLAMAYFVDVDLTMTTTNTAFANKLRDILLKSTELDSSRIIIKNSGSNKTVTFDYSNAGQLTIHHQKDDVRLAGNALARRMMNNLMRILEDHENYLLIRKPMVNNHVPGSLRFTNSTPELSSVSKAVLSRIGSYLKRSPGVSLDIIGHNSSLSKQRMQAVADYLIEWGISENRINTKIGHADSGKVQFNYLENQAGK